MDGLWVIMKRISSRRVFLLALCWGNELSYSVRGTQLGSAKKTSRFIARIRMPILKFLLVQPSMRKPSCMVAGLGCGTKVDKGWSVCEETKKLHRRAQDLLLISSISNILDGICMMENNLDAD